MTCHIDFETYSRAPLKVCGAYRYAQDPTTEILCCCWAIDEGEVETWVPGLSKVEARGMHMNQSWHYGPRIPQALAGAVASGMTIVAHNSQFERAIWQAVVVRRHGGPQSKRSQFVCTAARAAASNLPRSLDGAASALELVNQKDKEGARLLKLFAMPRKPTKKDDRTRILPAELHEEFIALCWYCADDVRAERGLDEVVPHLHPAEQRLFEFDMLINERGLRIDTALVRKTATVVAALELAIKLEVNELTKCEQYPNGLNPTQRDKIKQFFWDSGVELENLKKDYLNKYLLKNAGKISDVARRLLMLRMEASKASTKKLASMLAYCTEDERARGTLLIYGAHTGRWCLEMGTKLLVRDKYGQIAAREIQDLMQTDELWDGEEWVSHSGITYSGVKWIVEHDGVRASAHHMVWVAPDRKMPLIEAKDSDFTLWRTRSIGHELSSLPRGIRNATFDVIDAGPRNRFALANGAIVSNSGRGIQPHNFIRGTLKYDEQLRIFALLEFEDPEVFQILYEWPISRIAQVMRGFITAQPGKILRVVDYASIEARVLAWLAQEFRVLKIYIDGLDVYKVMAASVYSVKYDDVTSEQRRIGKSLVLGCFAADTEVLTSRGWVCIEKVRTSDSVWDGFEWVEHGGSKCQGVKEVILLDGVQVTPDHLIWNGSRWVAASDMAASSQSLLLGLSAVRLPSTFALRLNKRIVFDIMNCGPRSQFVIRTRSGSLIVHNCGYGLGGAKFVSYSEAAGIDIEEAFAKAAVKRYRLDHPKIVRFWADVERCAITAVRERRSKANAVVLRNLKFYTEDQWFCIELPSTRCLRYFRPRVVPVEKFGEPALQLQYRSEVRGRLYPESSYGGKLVENITQAVARDLLVCGMFSAEEAGYPVVGTVHDEIITEVEPDFGSHEELEQIVCKLPPWADGLPIAAEGFSSVRYHK